MKLFQNLSTDLAQEVVKSLFLFMALAAILFNVAEPFEQFLVEGHLRNIPVKLFQNPSTGSFKGFSIFSPGGHLVQWEQKGLSNFGRQSPKEHSCTIISKSMHWLRSRRRSRLKVFLFLALVAILFHEAEPFEQFW